MKHTSPIKLTAARAWRTYTGGREIDRIHGIENGQDGQFPEEWIMSTVTARNPGREGMEEGMCYLEKEGMSLKAFSHLLQSCSALPFGSGRQASSSSRSATVSALRFAAA